MPHQPTASMSDQQIRDRIASVPHWYHQIEIRPGITTPGVNDSTTVLRRLDLPARCDGLRALDIGARDGFFSFELERRGAEVVAIDYIDPSASGFAVARELLDAEVECAVCNVYDLDPRRHGTFDVVLFLGLLYHLRDPLLALDRIWDVCRPDATLVLETQLLDNALLVGGGRFRTLADIDPDLREACLMQFYPGDALNGDHSNYWAPNAACLRGLLDAAGFRPTAEDVAGQRGIFHARRIVDPTAVYHRRLEKTTVEQAGGPATTPGADGGGGGDGGRLEVELASARQHLNRRDAELAGAREYIRSLEAEVQRKEAHLVAAHEREAPGAGPPRGGAIARRVRRAAHALRRR
jgi:tRNA (mo5U34)-methyltransferase